MAHKNSVEKIIEEYLACVTKVPFKYAGKVIKPQTLFTTDSIARETTCAGCGACCGNIFTLDWLPFEELPDIPLEEHEVEFNGKSYTVLTDYQRGNDTGWCKFIDQEGHCAIHQCNPFSCDFEILRFIKAKTNPGRHQCRVEWYHRAVRMRQFKARNLHYYELRKDSNGKDYRYTLPRYRPQCSIGEPSIYGAEQSIRKLKRLLQWAEYFELETFLPDLIRDLDDAEWKNEYSVNGSQKGQRHNLMDAKKLAFKLIKKGIYTRKDIQAALVNNFPQINSERLSGILTEAKNPKYGIGSKVARIDENGAWTFL